MNKHNDKIVRQAVITQGKKEGCVVFSIARVAKLAVRYAYPAQNNKRHKDAIRLRTLILPMFVFSNYNCKITDHMAGHSEL